MKQPLSPCQKNSLRKVTKGLFRPTCSFSNKLSSMYSVSARKIWRLLLLKICKSIVSLQLFLELVQNSKSQSIEPFHQYLVIGVGNPKTRDFVCSKYEQLVRDNLIDKDRLPAHMITTLINSRTVVPGSNQGGGGSTTSSGSNSIVGSSLNFSNEKNFPLARLISTIICHTLQPSS